MQLLLGSDTLNEWLYRGLWTIPIRIQPGLHLPRKAGLMWAQKVHHFKKRFLGTGETQHIACNSIPSKCLYLYDANSFSSNQFLQFHFRSPLINYCDVLLKTCIYVKIQFSSGGDFFWMVGASGGGAKMLSPPQMLGGRVLPVPPIIAAPDFQWDWGTYI